MSKIIRVGVIAIILLFSALIVYHNKQPSYLLVNHNEILDSIINNTNLNEPDPLGYIQKQVESEYIKELMKGIQKNHDILEDIEFQYAQENYQLILDHITSKVIKDKEDITELKVQKILSDKYDKKSYYDDLIENVLLQNAPTTPDLKEGKPIFGYSFNNVWNPCFSIDWLRQGRVEVNDEAFRDLQFHHDNIVKTLRDLPEPPKQLVHGDGIVINGGGDYLLGALNVIGQLRELGSELPIELILTFHSEYDEAICENLLSKFNARCLVVEQEIGAPLLKKLKLEKFQLKVLGLLVTSFDNIIALDADNFPVINPDKLLRSTVYLKTKFILWPDIWHKGTSPIYYDIARFEIGEPTGRLGLPNDHDFRDYILKNKNTDVMLHDLEGTPPALGAETGQMVFSKKMHYKSFLLALYYNVYGYSHYYPLLYQGVFGSGDRETFMPALHVMNEPYHIVQRETWLAGFDDEKGKFHETTLVQYDPEQSDMFMTAWKDWLLLQGLDTRLWPYQKNDYTKKLVEKFKEYKVAQSDYYPPEVMFLHIHRPKINAIANASPHENDYDDLFTRRNLGKLGKYSEFTKDWELIFHSISKWFVCEGITSKGFWRDVSKLKQSEVCEKVTDYVSFLKEDGIVMDGQLKVVGKN